MPDQIGKRDDFGNHRRNAGTAYSHCRGAEMAQDKRVIEEYIGDGHENSRGRKNPCLGDADIEPPENHIQKREKETVDTPVEVFDGCLVHMFGADQELHDMRNSLDRESNDKNTNQEIKYQAVVEYRSYLAVVLLSIASPDKDLGSLAKAEADHENGNVKYAANSRSTQLHFSYTTQKSRIGDINNVLSQQCQKNRIGYVEYVFVRGQELWNL